MKKENLKTVAKINNVSITMFDDGNKMVPIKPLCKTIGVTTKKQIEKIKSDEILNSVGTLRVSTGKDKKEYEMFCLPYKFVFGWLFTINPKNVKPEAKQSVLKYKLECYNVLYDFFTSQSKFLQEKQDAMIKKQDEVDEIRSNFNQTKKNLETSRKELKDITNYSFDEWRANDMQMSLFSEQEQI